MICIFIFHNISKNCFQIFYLGQTYPMGPTAPNLRCAFTKRISILVHMFKCAETFKILEIIEI